MQFVQFDAQYACNFEEFRMYVQLEERYKGQEAIIQKLRTKITELGNEVSLDNPPFLILAAILAS